MTQPADVRRLFLAVATFYVTCLLSLLHVQVLNAHSIHLILAHYKYFCSSVSHTCALQ